MSILASSIREKYLDFFRSKNHAIIPSAPLVPENDPSVLFNTAGMQPLVPYLLGEPHPLGNRLADVQKCVRTGDIDDVGDDTHLTFFEMLGNWSLGDYFKKESIAMSWEFLTSPEWLGLDPEMISVTVFEGDANAPRDEESAEIWKSIGMPEDRIAYLPAEDNWWAAGPTGPCGPDTEIFYYMGDGKPPRGSNKATDPKMWMEIWNNVFMQYVRSEENPEEVQKKLNELTSQIIGQAIEIHKKYHNSLTEKQINEMLSDKLIALGLKVEREKQIPIIEDGKAYGSRYIDIVVNKNIFIELKNNSNETEIKKGFLQTRSYLELGNGVCGLLLNFAFPTLGINRFNHYEGGAYKELLQTSTLSKLLQPCVDTGMGIERCTVTLNKMKSVYETDLFMPVLAKVRELVGEQYDERSARIIADHLRAATHMIADGVVPKNIDQGYILRRLIRRALREAYKMGYEAPFTTEIADIYIEQFSGIYESVAKNADKIREELTREEEKFGKTLKDGVREFEKIVRGFDIAFERTGNRPTQIAGSKAFTLFDTYGFPLEMTIELAKEQGLIVDVDGFNKAFSEHQEKSRTAAAGKFAGGLADHSGETTALHSACHLMLAGLRKVLGDGVHQAGSNITAERLRFDFTHPEKMTAEQIQAVEDFVNEAIDSGLTVTMTNMDKNEAKSTGVEGSFWEKYPDVVKVYAMVGANGVTYSRELCGGPHIENSENMGRFKIIKEESSSAGVRRIKAVLEK